MGSQQPRSTSRLLQLLAACLVLCCSCMAAANGCLEKERIALLQLRDSFYHPRPANLSEWPTWVGEDCCSWVGVSCPDAAPRRVVSVSLASRRRKSPELGGMVVNASLFAALEELQRLLLNDNQISGWIEPKGMLGLKKLQKVDLGENLLTDESVSSWLFDLPSLAEVDLSRNKLRSSSILKRFCGVKSLTSLTLDFNAMEGTIDPCVGNMLPLQLLSLQGNRLTGEIPSLSQLSSLETLVLGQNRLSGVFHFSSLAGHTNLTGVSLGGYGELEVDTELPAGWVPSFQLYGLALSGCSLNRRSGRRIPSFLSTQTTRMSVLALSRASIQGPIPAWLLDNVDDTLVLDGNNLSGRFPRPEGNRTRRLSLLDLSKNQIHGPMPPDMKTLLPELYQLNLSWNAFSGGMASFGQLGYLAVLDLSHNSLTGEIPAELTADGSRLRHLRLSHNSLEGSMLPPGSRLGQLAYLFLDNNRLTGPISPDLAKSPSLAILNLKGNLLSGALPRGLFALPSLAAVLLSGNRFRGLIPEQLCTMPGIRMLDLSANSFSGAVPRCLSDVAAWKNSSAMVDGQTYYGLESVDVEFWTKGRLEKLRGDDLNLFTSVDLSRNQLTGAIPVEVGAMAALRSLNISRNHISGGIPSSIQGLELIESLDLSHNQLTGSVPPQIASLRYLSVFCVAYNKLSERIPYGGHFSKLGGRC